MAPKSVTIQLAPGIAQATLPDHRKMIPGGTYVVDWDTFSRISNGARDKIIEVVSVNSTTTNFGEVWSSDNIVGSNPPSWLTTASATPATSQQGGMAYKGSSGSFWGTTPIGNVVTGTQDESWMYVFNNDASSGQDISAGDVLVWSNEGARQVTRTRPAVNLTSGVGTFAGVAIAALPHQQYGYIQVEGECGVATTSTEVVAGEAVAVDPTNAGSLASSQTPGVTISPVNTITDLVGNAASTGTFTLTYNTHTTTTQAVSITAAALQTALQATTGWPSGTTVTGATLLNAGGTFVITLPGGVGYVTIGTQPSTANFTVTNVSYAQSVAISSNVNSGTFTLTGNSVASSAIPYNASDAILTTDVNTITAFSGATVSGGPLPAATTITNTGTYYPLTANNQGLVATDASTTLTFGTALTTQASSGSLSVAIRSSKDKKPYRRRYNAN